MRDRSLPCVVISLDFELRWGWHDILGSNFDASRAQFEQEREVVPKLLKAFADRSVRATWATVGAVGCCDWNEYFARAPAPPRYNVPGLAVKREYADRDPKGILHFAPDLVHAILATPGQELGSHTFSHLYLREEGIARNDVAADLAAVCSLWDMRFGAVPRSLVFPRNQYAFIDVVRSSSVSMWRGNELPWYYDRRDSRTDRLLPKALRFADGINPLRRLAAPLERDMTRASLYLRLALPRLLWRLHLKRIERELTLLKRDEVFHIWFHPLNVVGNTPEKLSRVEQVTDLIAEMQSRERIISHSMADLIA
jgi:peptidoglycan/xylan/chitin deacetylase (PgdA/CDA1 family)